MIPPGGIQVGKGLRGAVGGNDFFGQDSAAVVADDRHQAIFGTGGRLGNGGGVLMLATFVDDILGVDNQGIIRDFQVHVVRHIDFAVHGEFAVNGDILGQMQFLAGRDIGAVVKGNVGLTVPHHSGKLFHVAELHHHVPLAVQHRHNLCIRTEGVVTQPLQSAVEFHICRTYPVLGGVVGVVDISAQGLAANVSQALRQVNRLQRNAPEGAVPDVSQAIRQVNGRQRAAALECRRANLFQGAGQGDGSHVAHTGQAIVADIRHTFANHHGFLQVTGKAAVFPNFQGSWNFQHSVGIDLQADGLGVPAQVAHALVAHGFQVFGHVEFRDVEHLVKGPLPDLFNGVRQVQLVDVLVLEKYPLVDAGDGVGPVVAFAVHFGRQGILSSRRSGIKAHHLHLGVRGGHVREGAVVEAHAVVAGVGHAVEQNLLAVAAAAQGSRRGLGLHIHHRFFAQGQVPGAEAVLANGGNAGADVYRFHPLAVDVGAKANGLHIVRNVNGLHVGKPGKGPCINFLDTFRNGDPFQAGAVEGGVADFLQSVGQGDTLQGRAAPEHSLGDFLQVGRQLHIGQVWTIVEDVGAKLGHTLRNGGSLHRGAHKGLFADVLHAVRQIQGGNLGFAERLVANPHQTGRHFVKFRGNEGVKGIGIHIFQAVRQADFRQLIAQEESAVAYVGHPLRNGNGSDGHIHVKRVCANGGDPEGLAAVFHRGRNDNIAGHVAVAGAVSARPLGHQLHRIRADHLPAKAVIGLEAVVQFRRLAIGEVNRFTLAHRDQGISRQAGDRCCGDRGGTVGHAGDHALAVHRGNGGILHRPGEG